MAAISVELTWMKIGSTRQDIDVTPALYRGPVLRAAPSGPAQGRDDKRDWINRPGAGTLTNRPLSLALSPCARREPGARSGFRCRQILHLCAAGRAGVRQGAVIIR